MEATVALPLWLELIAVGAGSVFGALSAIRHRLAVTGVLALAVSLGLGGGLIRDTLLQQGPPVALTDRVFLPTALGVGFAALLLSRWVAQLTWLIGLADALAVGLYATIGADRALILDLPVAGAVLVGVLAGTGGSLIHDVLLGKPAGLLRPGILLGVAAAAGVTVFAIAVELGGSARSWFVVSVAIVTFLRLGGVHWGWQVGPASKLVIGEPLEDGQAEDDGPRKTPK